MKFKKDELVHVGFNINLIFKTLNALVEIIGGIVLLFMNPVRMGALITNIIEMSLFSGRLSFLAEYLDTFGSNYSIDNQRFFIIYLLTHGITKLIVVVLLWRQTLWAYPVSVLSVIWYIYYQMRRYTVSHSPMLLLLTAIDFCVIVLTVLEYQRIKKNRKKSTSSQ